MTLRVRAVGDEEEELGRMSRSRALGAGLVRRAQIVTHALEGLKAPEISARIGLCGATVRHWPKRFNAHGLEGLEEDVRTGRPPTCSAEERGAVTGAALTRPLDLGLPFAAWTPDRLVAHLTERGIAMRRSRISEILIREGLKAPEICARMDLCGATVRHWLKRFNARGLEGLEEDVRTGRPPTYSAEERSAVISTAPTRPADLGLPFASWTLDRLVAHLTERGIGMRRSRIGEILIREGLRWRHEETWFGERVDPDFARKRGRSSGSTRQHRPAAS